MIYLNHDSLHPLIPLCKALPSFVFWPVHTISAVYPDGLILDFEEESLFCFRLSSCVHMNFIPLRLDNLMRLSVNSKDKIKYKLTCNRRLQNLVLLMAYYEHTPEHH